MTSSLIVALQKKKNFYGSKITLQSPAKINLYLNIIGKYPPRTKFAGFHRIESIAERISLCDEITIETKKEPRIEFFSNEKSLEGKNNLCVQAARLLTKGFKIPFGFTIVLKKNIPIGSGLGGGSSNAATVLLGINTLLKLGLSQYAFYHLGAPLGSDVNFFLAQSPFAFLYGRGEKVIPLGGKTLHHFIVWPGISLSTKMVYGKAKLKLTKFLYNAKIVHYALEKGDAALLKKSIFNALEKTALSLCGQLREVKKFFDNNGMFCKITGSGSAVYTIFDKDLPSTFENVFPKNWTIFKVKTF